MGQPNGATNRVDTNRSWHLNAFTITVMNTNGSMLSRLRINLPVNSKQEITEWLEPTTFF
jgi:hypothetical protein